MSQPDAQQQQQQQQPTVPYPDRSSGLITLKGTAIAGVLGAAGGVMIGYVQGMSLHATAFGMGVNWLLLSAPFLAIRETTLHYRYRLNQARGIDSLLKKDKDDLIATAVAGVTTGAGLGYIWRGPKAMPAGALMYGLIGISVQTGLSWMRNLRLQAAVAELHRTQAHAAQLQLQQSQPQQPAERPDKWWQAHWRHESEDLMEKTRFNWFRGTPSGQSPYDHWDPAQQAMQYLRTLITDHVDLGPWSSPLLNAFDVDYRKLLNAKICILEEQIEDLGDEIQRLQASLPALPTSPAPSLADDAQAGAQLQPQ
ncbi:hypothetical protein BC831DRAFT_463619 [Entophlyctis helioformis]|nr:hypothetical protein BC831DRAFT_463619 [Entophlyctis helioformis]